MEVEVRGERRRKGMKEREGGETRGKGLEKLLIVG